MSFFLVSPTREQEMLFHWRVSMAAVIEKPMRKEQVNENKIYKTTIL